MRQFLDVGDITSEIRLLRVQFDGLCVVVESDKDSRAYECCSDKQLCQFIPAWGKEKVLSVLSELEKDEVPGIAGVVDADHWYIMGIPDGYNNLFLTDTTDLESMIMKTSALDRLLAEYGSPEKISIVESTAGNVRMILLNCAKCVSLVRLISRQDCLGLKFSGLRFNTFIDKNSLNVDENKMLRCIFANTGSLNSETITDITAKYLAMKKKSIDLWQLCSGDDLVESLCISLRKVLGSLAPAMAGRENIESVVRISFSKEQFQETKLYSSLKAWGDTNVQGAIV